MKSQKGFSAVEGLLIAVIVGILGFVGWYVMDAQKKTDQTLSSAASTKISSAKPSTKKATACPTADWAAYSSAKGQFSLCYPKNLVQGKFMDLCERDGVLLLGPTVDAAGACASDALGEVMVLSVEGDKRTDYNNAYQSNSSGLVTKSVTVNSVTGQRLSLTVKIGSGQVALGPQDGTKIVVYTFYTSGRTYAAVYTQTPSMTDVLSDFDLMVTKTLQFHS